MKKFLKKRCFSLLGQLPGNQPALCYPMPPYANLTGSKTKAVYAYLKSMPAITNKVHRKIYE